MIYKVTAKVDKSNTCNVAAKDYAEAVSKLIKSPSFEFLYGGGFTIEETNETFIY